jgi:hypothetical protein
LKLPVPLLAGLKAGQGMRSLLQFKSYLPGFLMSRVKPAIDVFAICAKFIARIELFFNVMNSLLSGLGF